MLSLNSNAQEGYFAVGWSRPDIKVTNSEVTNSDMLRVGEFWGEASDFISYDSTGGMYQGRIRPLFMVV